MFGFRNLDISADMLCSFGTLNRMFRSTPMRGGFQARFTKDMTKRDQKLSRAEESHMTIAGLIADFASNTLWFFQGLFAFVNPGKI